MADVTMTVNSDKTITLSTQSLGSQGERVSVDVVVPAAVAALGYEAYIDFLLPDGVSYYKGGYDCSSETFTFGLGETDSVMDKDGEVQLQFWVGTIVAAVKTVHWATAIKKSKVNQSIGATSAAILPYLPQMVIPTSYPAANISLEDAANRFTSAQVEAALAELAGVGRTNETVKANATAIALRLLSSAYTAADVLTKMKTVDGTGSLLDADLLDGVHANALVPYLALQAFTTTVTAVFGVTAHSGLYYSSMIPLPYANLYTITINSIQLLDGSGSNPGSTVVVAKTNIGFLVSNDNANVAGDAAFINFTLT